MEERYNKETEIKFLILGLRENELYGYQSILINQYYLDVNSNKDLIFYLIKNEINLGNYSEARIRIINNSEALITLKSNGFLERKEFEKRINILNAKKVASTITKKIEKRRYIIQNKNEDRKIEVDFYKDSNLVVAEVEFDKDKYTEKEMKNFIKENFKNKKIKNVTYDYRFKNSAIADQMSM